MNITEIKVFLVEEEKLKAYVTIVLDRCFVIRDLKVIAGNGGLFVAMPSKRRKDGSFKDIAHPVNQETRHRVEKLVLDAYLAELKTNPASARRQEEVAEDGRDESTALSPVAHGAVADSEG